jgi:hypothetical protein
MIPAKQFASDDSWIGHLLVFKMVYKLLRLLQLLQDRRYKK